MKIMYKINLVKLFYNIVSDNIPPLISDLALWRESQYNPRRYKKATVPWFSTHFMKNAISFGGAVPWNFVSDYLNDSHNGLSERGTTCSLWRHLALNQCIDVCRSEEVTVPQCKWSRSLSPLTAFIKSSPKGKKSARPSDRKLKSKKISCKFCRYEHPLEKKKCLPWGKTCKK